MGRVRSCKWILTLSVAILLVLLLRGFAFTTCLILSEGMEPTLKEGEFVLVNEWSYGLRTPFTAFFGYHRWREQPVQRGDVAVFNNPAPKQQLAVDRREVYINRCVAVPGDTLWVDARFSTVAARKPDDGNSTAFYPLVVPGKGMDVQIYPWNITLLRNMVVMHEKKKAEIVRHTLYVEGKPVQRYAFENDYYWMHSDNPGNLADSRLFGPVPHNHLIGKALLVWFSKEKGTGLFHGYRRERFFRKVE